MNLHPYLKAILTLDLWSLFFSLTPDCESPAWTKMYTHTQNLFWSELLPKPELEPKAWPYPITNLNTKPIPILKLGIWVSQSCRVDVAFAALPPLQTLQTWTKSPMYFWEKKMQPLENKMLKLSSITSVCTDSKVKYMWLELWYFQSHNCIMLR